MAKVKIDKLSLKELLKLRGELDTAIAMDGATAKAVGQARSLGTVAVRGMAAPVEVFAPRAR